MGGTVDPAAENKEAPRLTPGGFSHVQIVSRGTLTYNLRMAKKRAVIYTRLSRYRGAEDPSTSPERQRDTTTHYCHARDWEIVKVIEDLDVSGSEKGQRLRRPGVQQIRRMWDDIDVVVVPKLDRLARSVVDFHLFAEEARQHGVDLVSVHEGLDLTTPSGRFVASILAAFAQMEAETIAERTRAGMLGAAMQGRFVGGAPPYGYRSVPSPSGKGRSLEVEPAEAEAIREAVRQVLDGRNLQQVSGWMTENAPPPRRADGFTRTSLWHVLCGEAVLGRVTINGKVLRGEDGYPLTPFPPILTAQESAAVRKALAVTPLGKQRPVAGRRLLSGLLMCSGCGRYLTVAKRKGKVDVYRCWLSTTGGNCQHPVTCSAPAVEKYVEDEFLAEVGSLPVSETIVDVEGPDLSEVEEAIHAALAELATDATAEVFERLKALQAERDRQASGQRQTRIVSAGTVADAWAEAGIEGRRQMLANHYRKMVLLPGRRGRHGFDPSRLPLEPVAWTPPK